MIETLRNKLDNTSLREFISSLSLNGNKPGTAYGRKYSRALKAYVLGEQYLLPFDGPGFKAVRKHGLYTDKADGYIDQARDKIESKISEYPDVILIDFHELLRFEWQTEGKEPEDIDRIVIGWNAWRMLCAKDRSMFTETWIIENLVEIDYLAKELWEFYQEITNT